MHRSAAHGRALVAAARDSSSDQRLWPRPRPIRARPQAARPPREGQEKCIHRSADRTDRSGVPWAAPWLQRLGSTGSPQRSLPRLLTSISDNQLTPWKTHLIPGSNGISRSASFTILSDRIHQQNRVFIDAGNREDYLWSRQVNTGYEHIAGRKPQQISSRSTRRSDLVYRPILSITYRAAAHPYAIRADDRYFCSKLSTGTGLPKR